VSLAGFAFVDGGFDRAAHLRSSVEALDAAWPRARVLRLDVESRSLEGEDFATWPLGETLAAERPDDAVFIGLVDGIACFAWERLAEGAPTVDLRRAGMQWPGREAALFAAAAGLLNWQRRARFCGACGTAVERRQAGWSARCPGCGLEAYPRTDPAIIVAVRSGDRLLLGRQRSWPPGRWSVVAGFVEPGESLEAAVVREVHEEAGLRVIEPVYLGSQPWPFPASLMLGFRARLDPQHANELRPDGAEILDLRWFSRDELAASLGEILLPGRTSIARAIIEDWFGGPLDAP